MNETHYRYRLWVDGTPEEAIEAARNYGLELHVVSHGDGTHFGRDETFGDVIDDGILINRWYTDGKTKLEPGVLLFANRIA